MDTFTFIVLAIILGFLFLRVRKTFRKTRNFDRTEQIQRELQALRKKRDEANAKDEV